MLKLSRILEVMFANGFSICPINSRLLFYKFLHFFFKNNPKIQKKDLRPDRPVRPQRRIFWEQNGWTECTNKCGPGTQKQKFVCYKRKGTRKTPTKDRMCIRFNRGKKPTPKTRECTGSQCKWSTGSWSQCENSLTNKQCRDRYSATFTKTREVECLLNSRTVQDHNCRAPKPDDQEVSFLVTFFI